MGRTYMSKNKRSKTPKIIMDAAAKDVIERERSLRMAADIHGIHFMTLQRYVKKLRNAGITKVDVDDTNPHEQNRTNTASHEQNRTNTASHEQNRTNAMLLNTKLQPLNVPTSVKPTGIPQSRKRAVPANWMGIQSDPLKSKVQCQYLGVKDRGPVIPEQNNQRPKVTRKYSIPGHQLDLIARLVSLWEKGQLCDAGIGNGTSTVMVHKAVLLATCPKLMSRANASVNRFMLINVQQTISHAALTAFAEYMYRGVLDLNPQILDQLRQIALCLEVNELKELCDTQLATYLLLKASQANCHSSTKPFVPVSLNAYPSTSNSQRHISSKFYSLASPSSKIALTTNSSLKCVAPESRTVQNTEKVYSRDQSTAHNQSLREIMSASLSDNEPRSLLAARLLENNASINTKATEQQQQVPLTIKTEPVNVSDDNYGMDCTTSSRRSAESRKESTTVSYSKSRRTAAQSMLEVEPATKSGNLISTPKGPFTTNSSAMSEFLRQQEKTQQGIPSMYQCNNDGKEDISNVSRLKDLQQPYPVGLVTSDGVSIPLEIPLENYNSQSIKIPAETIDTSLKLEILI